MARAHPMRDALRSRDLRLLLTASTVDEVGGWAYQVVLIAYVYSRTGSATWVAVASTQGMVTAIALVAWAGVLADRYDRRRLLVVTSSLSAVAMTGIALWVAADGPMWLFPLLAVTNVVVSLPTRPAAGALVPEVVPESDLAAANGMFSALQNIVVVLGPAVGAALLLLTDSAVAAVGVNAASYVVSAVVFAALAVRSRGDAAAGGGALAQWLDGVRALTSNRVAFVLVLFAALDSAVYGAVSTLYLPLSAELGLGSAGYSYLLGVTAIGGVVAVPLANRLARSPRLTLVLVGGMTVECLPVAATALTDAPGPVLALHLVSGVGMVVVDVLAITALQRDLPRGVLSRVLASMEALILLAIVLASFLAAALLPAIGLDASLVVIGLGVLGIGVAALPVALGAERASAERATRLGPVVSLLAGLDLFEGASRNQLEQLAALAEPQLAAPGTVLIRQGEDADALWVLSTGSLDVEATVDGDVLALPAVPAPGYVGELGLLHDTARTATVVVAEPSDLLRIDAQSFRSALERTPASRSVVRRADERLARTAVPAPREPALG